MRKSLLVLVLSLIVVVLAPVAVMAAGGPFHDDDDSAFEEDINWLAGAGVTAGCNPPTFDEFCPGSSVTRGQMAAFMRRFAKFLDAEDGQVAAADNAETVGGLHPGDLIRINGAAVDTPINNFTAAVWTDIVTMHLEAPVDGVLHVAGSVGVEDDSTLVGNSWTAFRLTIDGVSVHSLDEGYTVELSGDPGDEPFSTIASLNAAVAVTAGNHEVSLQAREYGAGAYMLSRSVSAIFSAFGGGVSIPVGEIQAVYDN